MNVQQAWPFREHTRAAALAAAPTQKPRRWGLPTGPVQKDLLSCNRGPCGMDLTASTQRRWRSFSLAANIRWRTKKPRLAWASSGASILVQKLGVEPHTQRYHVSTTSSSSGDGRCRASATSAGVVSHPSNSASLRRSTGIALGVDWRHDGVRLGTLRRRATLPSAQGLERPPKCIVLYALEARMQIVVKMKVIWSPPGRILKERPLTARERLQPVHPRAEREPLQFGPQSHMAERR